MREILASSLPTFTSEEKKLLQNKLDFIGINHYMALYVKDCMFSSCALDGYNGNALVFATGERNGIPIGEQARVLTLQSRNFFAILRAIHPYKYVPAKQRQLHN